MIVKITDAPGVVGGLAVQLCDDGGEPLPMQFSTTLSNDAGDIPVVTVSFHIDGERNRLEK